eukprot:scaffold12086_cov67-Phaeocystis_antarctica.AAC.9
MPCATSMCARVSQHYVRALLPEVPLAHLPALVNAQRPQCGARQSAARLDLLDHVHPLDHVAEDHVPSIEVVRPLPRGSKAAESAALEAANSSEHPRQWLGFHWAGLLPWESRARPGPTGAP